MSDHTTPSDGTQAEESREASKQHQADREPTPEEEAAAEKHTLDPKSGEAYKEMAERGAHQQGEGKPGT